MRSNDRPFLFTCGSYGSETLFVAGFCGEDRISSPYSFTARLHCSDRQVKPESLLGYGCRLSFTGDKGSVTYCGIVLEAQSRDEILEYNELQIKFGPRLYLLSLQFRSRVFQDLSVIDIVKSVMEENGISDYVRFEIGQRFPVMEYCVQYQETDLNFISRLLEHYGIWFFFEENPDQAIMERMVITDLFDRFIPLEGGPVPLVRSLGFAEENEGVAQESVRVFHRRVTLTSCAVYLRNENYRTPEVKLEGRADIQNGHHGTIYQHGGSFKNVQEAQFFARLAAQRLEESRSFVEGKGCCRSFRAGRIFTLGREREENFLLTSVCHRGGYERGVYTYENEFICKDCLSGQFAPEKRTAIPQISGILTAKVESLGDTYPTLDDMGRYKVRLPFDLSEADECAASKYVRLSQPLSGQGYGIHFPLRKESEMVLACIGGDPNKPVGLGSVPHAGAVSPVKAGNSHLSIIRTAGGNELVMDDAVDKQNIRLSVPGGATIELNDETRVIVIATAGKNKLILDDKEQSVSLMADGCTLKMSSKEGQQGIAFSSAGGHELRVDDKSDVVSLTTRAGHFLHLSDKEKTLSFADCEGKSSIILDGKGGLELSSQGDITISSTKDVVIKGQNIRLAGNRDVEIKASGTLDIQGAEITQKATSRHSLEGAHIAIEGVDVKLAGTTTEVAGEVTLKMEAGTAAELKGGVVASIQGAVVKIN